MNTTANRSIGIWIITVIAIVFGALTIKSGGQVLFAGDEFRAAAGDYVPFVVWFNFCAGFFYLIAGAGLWLRQAWAVWLSVFVAAATVIVFAAFGVHILKGGAYELRTVAAMSLRSIVWISIAWFAYRNIIQETKSA